ncbi:uncharacterized protein LOC129618627 [Condylostylus longicornis]|uniref:uncharacterized protein LOC129618627 n=1 Tax=Condylostylus longicornis TaxID=2530218 RepID=UPI00244DC3BB|nr:uncharacterized protein LOC129618627 [Condylostylus longicornis]
MDRKNFFLLIVTLFVLKESVCQLTEFNSNDIILKSIPKGKLFLQEYLDGLTEEITKNINQTIIHNQKLSVDYQNYIKIFINGLENNKGKISSTQTLEEKILHFIQDQQALIHNLAITRNRVLNIDMKILSTSSFELDKLSVIFEMYRKQAADNTCKQNLYNTLNYYEENRLIPTITKCPTESFYNIPTISSLTNSIQNKNLEKFSNIRLSLVDCKNGWSLLYNRCINKIGNSLNDFLKEIRNEIDQNNKDFKKVIEQENKSNSKCLSDSREDIKERFDDFAIAFKNCK